MLADVVDRRLCRLPARLLRDLIDQGSCSTDRMIDQLWGHDEGGGPLNAARLVRQYIHEIRRALRPGWRIINHRNWGYRLERWEPNEMKEAA